MRPKKWDDFVGQQHAVAQIKLALQAAKARKSFVDHILLSGPPGLGKTTIAHIVSNESGGKCIELNANIIKTPADALAQIVHLRGGDVLFIDEIHSLPPQVQEFLYPAMEDYRISTISQLNRKAAVMINLQRFILIGATTIEGQLTGPMRDRFGIVCRLVPYSVLEIENVIVNASLKSGYQISKPAVTMIAQRSRSTPRTALKFLRRIHDCAVASNSPNFVSEAHAIEGFRILRIREHGLNDTDVEYLRALAMSGDKPVGLQALSAMTNISEETIMHVVEPHLMRIGCITRTQKGRIITEHGKSYAKL